MSVSTKPRYRRLQGEWVLVDLPPAAPSAPFTAASVPSPSAEPPVAGAAESAGPSSAPPDYWQADLIRRTAEDSAKQVAQGMLDVVREHLPPAEVQRASGLQTGVAYSVKQNSLVQPAKNAFATNDPWLNQTPVDPRYRLFSRLTVDSLRLMARNYDILAACITHLKSDVVKMPIKIVPREEGDESPKTKQAIEEMKLFLGVSGGMGGFGAMRAEYEAKLLDDLLIVGAAASFLDYDTLGARRDGNPDEIIAIDAATIRPLVTPYGFAPEPDADAYEQWIMGAVMARFKREELIYRGLPIYARSDSPYYLSPVELILAPVYSALRVDEWNRSFFTDGNTPDEWMKMPETMTPQVAQEWMEMFDDMMVGNTGGRRRMKVTPGEPRNARGSKDGEFSEFDKWMMQRTCSGMGVNPASIGHHSDTYKDSQDIATKSTKEGRVEQLLEWRRNHYDDILARKGCYFLQVVEDAPDEEDATARSDRQTKAIAGGIKTINQVRKENGDKSITDPMADKLFLPTTLQPLEAFRQMSATSASPLR